MKVAVSFIKSKYKEKETIELINKTSADYIHVDLMDGKFVPNKNYDFEDIENFFADNKKPLDIHFMYEEPYKYIEKYAKLNPEIMTFHVECNDDINMIIDKVHSLNIKCGLSINPHTPISNLNPYLDKIDYVLVMSVVPGFGGQPFLPSAAYKVSALSKMKRNFILAVDGGINADTIKYVSGADMVISGSYVCMSDNYEEKINTLKSSEN